MNLEAETILQPMSDDEIPTDEGRSPEQEALREVFLSRIARWRSCA